MDVLTAGATPFDTGAGVSAKFYPGVARGPTSKPYVPYMFDITGVVGAGGTYQLPSPR